MDNGLKVIFLVLQDNLFLGKKLAGVSLAQNLVIRFFEKLVDVCHSKVVKKVFC